MLPEVRRCRRRVIGSVVAAALCLGSAGWLLARANWLIDGGRLPYSLWVPLVFGLGLAAPPVLLGVAVDAYVRDVLAVEVSDGLLLVSGNGGRRVLDWADVFYQEWPDPADGVILLTEFGLTAAVLTPDLPDYDHLRRRVREVVRPFPASA